MASTEIGIAGVVIAGQLAANCWRNIAIAGEVAGAVLAGRLVIAGWVAAGGVAIAGEVAGDVVIAGRLTNCGGIAHRPGRGAAHAAPGVGAIWRCPPGWSVSASVLVGDGGVVA